ncbi:hypothetical protein GCK32_019451, partial [Trichostrongylus colubriformis]
EHFAANRHLFLRSSTAAQLLFQILLIHRSLRLSLIQCRSKRRRLLLTSSRQFSMISIHQRSSRFCLYLRC